MWVYENKDFDQTPDEFQGFVYMVTELDTGKKYIGKKFFWKPKILPVTKTRKRRVRTRVESDWRTYYGSNKHLQQDVINMGEDFFHREIIHLCKTKGECAYMETKEQFEREVLLTEDYYNGIINCRIGGNAVKNLK